MDDSSNISNVVVGFSGTVQMKQHQTKAKSTTRISSGGNNKSKKKPIKVVYISNPMKVTASASEFRALVQQLTGQDADVYLPDLQPTHHRDDNNNPKQQEERRQQQANTNHDQQFLYADDDVDGLFVPEMLVDSFVPAAPSRQKFPLI